MDDNNNNPVSVVVEKNDIHKYSDHAGPSSSPLLPKLDFRAETSNEHHSSSSKSLSSSLESLCEVNNNNPKSSHDDVCDNYDDGLPHYDASSYPLLRHDDGQGAPLGMGRNGDVVLDLSP